MDEQFLMLQIMQNMIELVNDQPQRRQRLHIDPFELSDFNFIKLFRLDKRSMRELMEILSPFLREATRTSAISIETKVNIYYIS